MIASEFNTLLADGGLEELYSHLQLQAVRFRPVPKTFVNRSFFARATTKLTRSRSCTTLLGLFKSYFTLLDESLDESDAEMCHK